MQSLYGKKDKCRLINIKELNYRSAFRRDNGRLIHCASFRRLQGKTQLFPTYESDFFRNRLTHSLEVAQIAKGIAEYLNCNNSFLKQPGNNIDLDLIETAALAHDLGHPPFGHNGEMALDKKMKDCGGFEGNAQTLRILSRLEKKETFNSDGKDFRPTTLDGKDNRCGLNLTFRTLASVLKYDEMIPQTRGAGETLVKGYYYTEKDIVDEIKNHVLSSSIQPTKKFKTIECHIMDVADDIAYCTYDLEDALKGRFLSPMKILTSSENLLGRVAKKVSKYCNISCFGKNEVLRSLTNIFSKFFSSGIKKAKDDWAQNMDTVDRFALLSSNYLYKLHDELCQNGYYRTAQTSELVSSLMSSIKVKLNKGEPALSEVKLDPNRRVDVEVLKHYNYESVISSSQLRISEFRGQEIIDLIFDAIADQFRDIPDNFNLFSDNFESIRDDQKKGASLLPQDCRRLFDAFKAPSDKKRVVCDFIAGMTDKYAIEFYARLTSENPQTIFKPI